MEVLKASSNLEWIGYLSSTGREGRVIESHNNNAYLVVVLGAPGGVAPTRPFALLLPGVYGDWAGEWVDERCA